MMSFWSTSGCSSLYFFKFSFIHRLYALGERVPRRRSTYVVDIERIYSPFVFVLPPLAALVAALDLVSASEAPLMRRIKAQIVIRLTCSCFDHRGQRGR